MPSRLSRGCFLLLALFAITRTIGSDTHTDPEVRGIPHQVSGENLWRRTRDGWEKTTAWQVRSVRPLPPIAGVHPGLVSSMTLLVSCAGLLLFSAQSRRRP